MAKVTKKSAKVAKSATPVETETQKLVAEYTANGGKIKGRRS